MITYVNTVLVSNAADVEIVSSKPTTSDAGKFVILNCDNPATASDLYISTPAQAAEVKSVKIGLVTSKAVTVPGTATQEPVVKWSNIINARDIKHIQILTKPQSSSDYDTEDSVEIDFTNLDANVLTEFAKGGKRIIVRLTFKDLPTRYRKWTESYEYVTQIGDTKATIAANIADLITKEWKRARVVADKTVTNKITLTAMPYDDDDSVDSINWTDKVRFNCNIYYTDPAAEGWASHNKMFPKGVTIVKTPGERYPAIAKLVRDRESQAMGYLGILNRGEGTWPIIKPAMETDLSKGAYDAITLEFENMYRAADDIFRKTKQTVEIYTAGSLVPEEGTGLVDILEAFEKQEAPAESDGGEG